MLEFALGAALGWSRAAGSEAVRPARLALAGLGVAGLLLAALYLAGAGEVPGLMRPVLVGLPALCLVAVRPWARLGRGPFPGRRGGSRPWATPPTPCTSSTPSPCAPAGGPRQARPRRPVAPLGSLVALTLLSVAAALAVHRLVERPLTRRLRAVLDARENRVGVPPPPFSRGRGSLASAPAPPTIGSPEDGTMKTLLVPVAMHDALPSVFETTRLAATRFGSLIEGVSLRPALAEYVPSTWWAG